MEWTSEVEETQRYRATDGGKFVCDEEPQNEEKDETTVKMECSEPTSRNNAAAQQGGASANFRRSYRKRMDPDYYYQRDQTTFRQYPGRKPPTERIHYLTQSGFRDSMRPWFFFDVQHVGDQVFEIAFSSFALPSIIHYVFKLNLDRVYSSSRFNETHDCVLPKLADNNTRASYSNTLLNNFIEPGSMVILKGAPKMHYLEKFYPHKRLVFYSMKDNFNKEFCCKNHYPGGSCSVGNIKQMMKYFKLL